eukprot:2463906-Rhodomonas_salina.1
MPVSHISRVTQSSLHSVCNKFERILTTRSGHHGGTLRLAANQDSGSETSDEFLGIARPGGFRVPGTRVPVVVPGHCAVPGYPGPPDNRLDLQNWVPSR